jgi:chromosome segregation ATPase
MRQLLGLGAALLGGLGVLLCVLFVGLSWWIASTGVDRIDTLAARLDERLTQAEIRLARIEHRVKTAQTDLADVRCDAESMTAPNAEVTQVSAELDRLRGRLIPVLDRLSATAESLLALSDALNSAADVMEQLTNDAQATTRLHKAAGAIDRAATALQSPHDKFEAIAAAGAIELRQTLLTLVGKAIEGSDLLADGLAAARRESIVARKSVTEYRDRIAFWLYVGAIAITFGALWAGLGQLCLCRHGRDRGLKAER